MGGESELQAVLVAAHGDGVVEELAEVRAGEGLVAGALGEDAAVAEEQGVGECWGDFLHVVGDQYQPWGCGFAGQGVHKREESFPGHGIQTGAGFVQDEQLGIGDESSGDEDALPFALGEHGPWSAGEVGAADAF